LYVELQGSNFVCISSLSGIQLHFDRCYVQADIFKCCFCLFLW